jgi:uncharacterized protein
MIPKSALLRNKEIFEMKLSVITDCILRCDYCFVDKQKRNSKMDLKTAQKSIDFFLNTRGKEKILKIYGGEPLLNFKIVKKIVPYAFKKASERKINLILSLCTNTILLKPEHLDFFKKNKLHLAISFDGDKETHNKFRKFPEGRGTFDKVKKNLSCLFKKIDKKDVMANMAIVPSEVGKTFRNFKNVLRAGFDTLNLEPIYGFQKWTQKKQKEFQKRMGEITNFIIQEIPKGNFYFLMTVNRELKYQTLSKFKKGVCLFYQFPEVYFNGRIAFSSFFLNLPEKEQKKYIVGNLVKSEIKNKYKNCSFLENSKKCQKCLEDYFDRPDESQSSKIVEIRNLLSINLANQIKKRAESDLIFKKYVQEIYSRS